MAATHLNTCDFVVRTKKAIFVETISFDEKFWETEVKKCEAFFKHVILPELVSKYYTNRSETGVESNLSTDNALADHSYAG